VAGRPDETTFAMVDPFIGRSAAIDVFGHIVGFLDKHI